MVLFRWFCVRLMINVSNRWCCNRLAWASVAGVTRLLGRSGSGCGVVVRAVLCSGWRRPTDGYVIDSTWVISPLFITHGRVAPQRLMNRFTGVTNTRASSLGGEITVREKKKKKKWAFCGAAQTEWDVSVWLYFTAGQHVVDVITKETGSCFLIFSAQFEHLAPLSFPPWGLLIWPGLIAP